MTNDNHFLFSKNIILNTSISIFLLVAFNSIFNSISFALGADHFASTFLMPPFDLFGDYFKAIFSFIQSEQIEIRGPGSLVQLLNTYASQNPYRTIDSITNIRSNLHGTPLSTSFALINLKLMTLITPLYLFLIMLVGLLMLTFALLTNIQLKLNERIAFLICFVFAYPSLFLLVRGHLYSALTTLSLLTFVLLLAKRKSFTALIFLAIAVNFRPNALIFIFALLFCSSLSNYLEKIKYLLIFIVMATLIFFLSLLLANLMYSEYSLMNFLTAVKMYHASYVVGNNGLAYGSSMLGAIKVFKGAAKLWEPLIFLTTILLLWLAIHLLIIKKISEVIFIYLICVLYQLTTSTFADYYLGIFFAPIIYQIVVNKEYGSNFFNCHGTVSFYTPYWACIFLLAPKNYIFISNISLQVVINPLISFTTMLYIIYKAFICKKTNAVK